MNPEPVDKPVKRGRKPRGDGLTSAEARYTVPDPLMRIIIAMAEDDGVEREEVITQLITEAISTRLASSSIRLPQPPKTGLAIDRASRRVVDTVASAIDSKLGQATEAMMGTITSHVTDVMEQQYAAYVARIAQHVEALTNTHAEREQRFAAAMEALAEAMRQLAPDVDKGAGVDTASIIHNISRDQLALLEAMNILQQELEWIRNRLPGGQR